MEYFRISEGRKHNAGMLADSGLLNNLQRFAKFLPLANPCASMKTQHRVHLQAPFRQGHLTPQMQAYNDAMSEGGVSVEWLFGDIINSFKFPNWKRCTWYVDGFEMLSLAYIKTKLHFF